MSSIIRVNTRYVECGCCYVGDLSRCLIPYCANLFIDCCRDPTGLVLDMTFNEEPCSGQRYQHSCGFSDYITMEVTYFACSYKPNPHNI